MAETALKRTPLYDEHVRLGAKMVPFAGYEMPVQYPTGVLTEHNWTREHAGLFDVSHMGQCTLLGPSFEETAVVLERLLPADVQSLEIDQQRYSQLLTDNGGVIDDLMLTRQADGEIEIVVNASRKEVDFEHIKTRLPAGYELVRWDMFSLIALQGPAAERVVARHMKDVYGLKFMRSAQAKIDGIGVQLSRSGYTGEDGFEISVHSENAVDLWNLLLSDPEVKPIGLGARDSLRLEAGLCLYGHELDETISPVEADLVWSIGKRRRAEGGFIGAGRVLKELAEGPKRKRVGIKPDGRAPARDGTVVQDMTGREIGKITSGGFGPTAGGPVAMGYVETNSSVPGTKVQLIVRGQALPATVVKLPFVPNRFKR